MRRIQLTVTPSSARGEIIIYILTGREESIKKK